MNYIGLTAYIVTILTIVILKFLFWFSLITSSVKAVSDSCGKEYGIESYGVGGNWFCGE